MDNIKNKLHGSIMRRPIILSFCLFVGMCVAVVMFQIYDPGRNSLGALASVCMDVLCIIILFVLVGSFVFDNYSSRRTTKLFSGLLLATIWAIFLDFLNWAFDGSLEFGHLTFWFTLGSLCMGSILAGIFSVYLYYYMEETHNLKEMRKSALICAILNLLSFCLTFILAITGTAFQFVDGHYETAALYDVVEIIPILTLLFLTGFVVCNIKKVGTHDAFAAAGYILFMIAGALIEASYGIGTTYVSVAIADIFIFVMIQNEIIAHEKRNVQLWMKRSNTDELTGFYNRHAYESDIKILDSGELRDDFVYVSCDVNSLKVVNDTLGHSAGDELLIGAAECLKKAFGSYGKLYRIGGDEFVAIIFVEYDQLDRIKNDIEKTTQLWSGKLTDKLVLSCGYVAKKEIEDMPIRQIAILADKRMYDAKAEYYRSAGIERRRNR